MDEVIFEEFKGTGNMEINLTGVWWIGGSFPLSIFKRSGTRKEELLLERNDLNRSGF